MTFSGGTCIGALSYYSAETAFTQARNQAASTAKKWRLPNIKELSTIVEHDHGSIEPAIDMALFPATPLAYFWTSTPYVSDPSQMWQVDFSTGQWTVRSRYFPIPLRLVRFG
jgi:uncharacterized lipoprotein YddW (UPF0748 family)